MKYQSLIITLALSVIFSSVTPVFAATVAECNTQCNAWGQMSTQVCSGLCTDGTYSEANKSLILGCARNSSLDPSVLRSCVKDPVGTMESRLTTAQHTFYEDCVVTNRDAEACMINTLTRTNYTVSNPVDVGGVSDEPNGGGVEDEPNGGGVEDEPNGVGGRVTFKLENPLRYKSISGLITAIIKLMIQIGLSIAVLFIVYAGFLFVTASGNSEKVTEAKKVLLWAVVGSAILLGALVIMSVIQNTITQVTTI